MSEERSVWCVDVNTTCQLMSRSRGMIWIYMRDGKLGFHVYGSNTLVFLEDIAGMLNQSEDLLIDRLYQMGLPVWRCWKDTMLDREVFEDIR